MRRRTFLKTASLAVCSSPAVAARAADRPSASGQSWADACGLKRLGALKTRSARDIKDSRIGIGMECLDRRMYLPEKTYGHLAVLGAKWARLQTGKQRRDDR